MYGVGNCSVLLIIEYVGYWLALYNDKLEFTSIIFQIDWEIEMVVTERFNVNNKKISYLRYGREWKETAILFFHGFTGSKKYIPIYKN